MSGRNLFVTLGLAFVAGVVAIQGLIYFDHYTSTEEFCTSCHSMEIVAQEYRQTVHYNSRSGVRAKCGDCHVSEGVFAASWDHFMGYKDLLAQLFGPEYDDKVIFDLYRPEMAFGARKWFAKSGSATCQRCHVLEAIHGSKIGVNEIHLEETEGKTCIDCHYNLVHRKVPHERTFKRDAWNKMIEEENGLEPGTAEKILSSGH